MNKQILYIIAAILIAWFIIDLIQKQNKKINGLTYGLSGLQNSVTQFELVIEFGLQQIDDMNSKIEQDEKRPPKDFIWASEPEPIAISTVE